MKIESLHLKNYKAFREIELKALPSMAVFVGANGTGKSTLFDVLAFLKDCLKNNVRTALDRRGGIQEVRSRNSAGPITIELQFRLELGGANRLVTYALSIEEEKGKPIIAKEILRYKRGRHGSPFHFLNFERGKGYAILNEEDFNKKDEELEREEQELDVPYTLAIKGLGQFKRFKAANTFRQFIESWQLSDFRIGDARKTEEAGLADHLSPTGDNLARVTQYLYEDHPEIFQSILDRMAQRVPGVSNVQAEQTQDGRVLLKFQDGSFKDPFIDRYVSDGTIKMFAYLVLLYDPKPHPLLSVEEPENQLYPRLLYELAEEFRDYARRGGQVFISTHSPEFLNACRPEEVYWLEKRQGYTQVYSVMEVPMVKELAAEGDMLGHLWDQGYLQPPRTQCDAVN